MLISHQKNIELVVIGGYLTIILIVHCRYHERFLLHKIRMSRWLLYWPYVRLPFSIPSRLDRFPWMSMIYHLLLLMLTCYCFVLLLLILSWTSSSNFSSLLPIIYTETPRKPYAIAVNMLEPLPAHKVSARPPMALNKECKESEEVLVSDPILNDSKVS